MNSLPILILEEIKLVNEMPIILSADEYLEMKSAQVALQAIVDGVQENIPLWTAAISSDTINSVDILRDLHSIFASAITAMEDYDQ